MSWNESIPISNTTFLEEKIEFCGVPNEDLQSFLGMWLDGVTVSALGIFGLIGNCLSILTISTMSKLKLFYKLILTLAVFDLMFITCGGLLMVQQAFKFQNDIYNALFPHIIYPGSGFSMTGSTYTCLAITVERFCGICHPNSPKLNRRFRYYVFGIIFICILIDAPRFLEVEVDYTSSEQSFKYSKLRTNPTYIMAYTMWYRLFATVAIPFGLTLFFNIRVLIYCRKNNLQTQSNHERSLLIIFACITITFLVCHIPRVILNIYEFTLQKKESICFAKYKSTFNPPVAIVVAVSIEKILLILNSSANFVYYCFSGNRFRNQFCQILKCTFRNKTISNSQIMKNNGYRGNGRCPSRSNRDHLNTRRSCFSYDMDRIKCTNLSEDSMLDSIRIETTQTDDIQASPPIKGVAKREQQIQNFLGEHYDEILI